MLGLSRASITWGRHSLILAVLLTNLLLAGQIAGEADAGAAFQTDHLLAGLYVNADQMSAMARLQMNRVVDNRRRMILSAQVAAPGCLGHAVEGVYQHLPAYDVYHGGHESDWGSATEPQKH